MKVLQKLLLFSICLLMLGSCDPREETKILIFTKTKGYRHQAIPFAKTTLMEACQKRGIQVDTTENADYFTNEKLKAYKAVVFLSTTGDVLNPAQQNAFEKFIRDGKGFVGIHAAADTEYDWPWYGKLVGAYFESHPEIQEAKINIKKSGDRTVKMFGPSILRTDEWYNYKNIQEGLDVLMELDESSYEGGKNGVIHPIAWKQNVAGGRAFYTGGGHTEDAYREPLFMEHLLEGISFATGVKLKKP